MPVDRLSVTVSAELGTALRALAEERATTVSTVVSDAIAHELRLAALDRALAEADRRFGQVGEARVVAAEAELLKAAKQAPRVGRGRRRRRAA